MEYKINYSPLAPNNIRVSELNSYSTLVFDILLGKSEDFNKDWIFSVGARSYEDEFQGFLFLTRDGKDTAEVLVEIDDDAMVCAEENDRDVITVIVANKIKP